MPHLSIRNIKLGPFNDVLSRYSSHVPEKLQNLDELRYATIPATFAARREPDPHLAKDEVEKLVEWKLKHGTFRPKLLSLAQSNSTESVTSTTKQGFEAILESSSDGKAFDASVMASMKIVTQLKGIGPATASLLLSVMRPDDVPFFSDELFRWCTWDSVGSPSGWQRGIKYNVKEYAELLGHVRELRGRLGQDIRAMDVERVAWVLGKEGVDVGADDEIEEEVKQESEEKRPIGKPTVKKSLAKESKVKIKALEEEKALKAPKRGTKRSASNVKLPSEGVRKSSRTKK